MRLPSVALLLVGLLIGTDITSAAAGTFSYGSYGLSGSNVHVSAFSLGIKDEYGGSGLITLKGSAGALDMAAYCVDIAAWLLSSATYNVGIDPASNPNLSGVSSITGDSKIADISALIFNGGNAAAVQLAIWETEYGAAATFTPDDSGLQAMANAYFTHVRSDWSVPLNFDLYELTPADGNPNQTLVYLIDPPAVVAEPGSLALLAGAALLTAVLLRRRWRD